jgi:hypothetical protein
MVLLKHQDAGMTKVCFGLNVARAAWVVETFVTVDQSQPMHVATRRGAAEQ